MAIARLRKLLIALLVAAQPASAVFAATAPVIAAPCPVHSAFMQAPAQDASSHEGHAMAGHEMHAMHGAPGETSPQEDEGDGSTALNFACCAAHMAGVLAQNFPVSDDDWAGEPAALIVQPLTSGDLSSVDPPPRIFL